MNARNIVGLGLLAVVAAGLALWLVDSRAPQQDVGLQGPLLPGLVDRLNAVDEVKVVGAGGKTLATLQRQPDGWTLLERDGYPADAAKLRALLVGLSEARRVEAKTSNPALYDRLGVEDVSAAEAKGVALEIIGGGEPLRLILGQNNARGKGTYVRLDGEASSWLLDRNIAVERQPVEWLQRDLIDLPPARVASVEVVPADGAAVNIGRAQDAAGDFELQNLPRGRQPASEFVADATAGLLDALRFDDVLPADGVVEGDSGARSASFRSKEGLSIALRAWQTEGKTYARFSAELDEAEASAWAASQQPAEAADDASAASVAAESGHAPGDASAEADGARSDDAQAVDAKQQSAAPGLATAEENAGRVDALRAELATLQQRFEGRVFVLPAYKAASLNRDLDAYLKPLE
jgi:hypothetical protein